MLDAAPQCAAHPESPAVGACSRCGTFVCALDRHELAGQSLCAACAARPEAEPVEAYRLKHWGKRDLWAWAMGLSAAPQAWILYRSVDQNHGSLWIAIHSALLVLDVAYFLGHRWTRYAMLVVPVLSFMPPPGGSREQLAVPGVATTMLVFQFGFALLAAAAVALMFVDVRNRLFFRLEIPRPSLERAYRRYQDNQIAVWGLVLSFAGFLIPGLSMAGLPMSITALLRAYSDVTPPVGRVRMAVAGIVVGLFNVVFWAGFILAMMRLAELAQSGQLKP